MTEPLWVCLHCKATLPMGELEVGNYSHGFCIACYQRLADIPPARMSKALAMQVEAALDEISTDFFTRA